MMSLYVRTFDDLEDIYGIYSPCKFNEKVKETTERIRKERGERKKEEESSTVSHPKHYKSDTGLECIIAIRAMLGREGFIAYCQGNVLKYNWRWKLKHGEEDLRKAKMYQDFLTDESILDFKYEGGN